MPTGYTAKLAEGVDQTFAEFAMECARAFGALVEMRDDPSSPIPEKFEPGTWHERELTKAQVSVREVQGWTPARAEYEAKKAFSLELAAWTRSMKESRARRERYYGMLDQVRAWEPPTPEHEKMKEFMAGQLQTSIDFDCGYEQDRPEPQAGPDFAREALARAERDVAYHARYLAEDIERAQGRTAWIRALRESLGIDHA